MKLKRKRHAHSTAVVCMLLILLGGCAGGGGDDGLESDSTSPTILTITPASDTEGVGLNSAVSAVFSENVDSETISSETFTLISDSDSAVDGEVSYDSASFTATFTPSASLSQDTVYTATISASVTDIAGNEMEADVSWSFTTGDEMDTTDTTAPSITSVTPSDGSDDVAVDTTVSATFSEDMNSETILSETFTLVSSSAVPGTMLYDSDSRTVTFTPSMDLSEETTYTATITTSVTDVAGNQMESDTTWSFSTATFGVVPDDTRLEWEYDAESGGYYSSPAIGPSGTIYFGAGYWRNYTEERENRGLYAINSNGTLKWYYAIDEDVFSPVVDTSENIYVQDYDNNLYALDSDGSHLWTYPAGEEASNVGCTTPAISADGTRIYMTGPDKSIHAVNLVDGSNAWTYDSGMGGELRTSPAVGSDGTIYVSMGSQLRAIDTDGDLVWSEGLPGTSDNFSSPAIGADGTLYVGSEPAGGVSYVHAVNSAGVHQWRYEVTGSREIRSSPVIGADGTIYIGTKASDTDNALMLALNSNGTLKWSYEIEESRNDIYVSPSVGDDGTVYIGHEWGVIIAFDGDDGAVLWEFDDPENGAFNWSSPAIASDGTLYITNTYGGRLLAIDTDSTGLADSVWPKFHNNNQNTGKD